MAKAELSLLTDEGTLLAFEAKETLVSWSQSQKVRGFEVGMHETIIKAIDKNPLIIGKLLNDLAHVKGIPRNVSNLPSQMYPLEAAIRFVGNKHKAELGAIISNPLSVNSWTAEGIITVTRRFGNEIIEATASRTMAKNLPHRAAFILWLLGSTPELQNRLNGKKWFIVELGASAGLITTALTNLEDFLSWASNQNSLVMANDLLKTTVIPRPLETIGLGIDLLPPDNDWVWACIDRDRLREETRDFALKFEQRRALLIKGDVADSHQLEDLQKLCNLHRDSQVIVLASMFLYQLPKVTLERFHQLVREFLKQTNGLLVFADSNRLFEPDKPGWLAWVETLDGKISPTLYLQEEPCLFWRKINDPENDKVFLKSSE